VFSGDESTAAIMEEVSATETAREEKEIVVEPAA
jgi:hypothetical protein